MGKSDPVYHHGQLYQLRLRQHLWNTITIIATHGYQLKAVVGTARTYANLTEFLHEWTIVRPIEPQEK
jgi:hypothetical protein